MQEPPSIAYFTMEIGLEPAIPSYSGGLGVLAGDIARAAAALHVPMVAVSLLYRHGYFTQRLSEDGWQHEDPVEWSPLDHFEPLDGRAEMTLEGRTVRICAWRYLIRCREGGIVPVILLDTDLAENDPADRALTHHLYGGDERYRLRQEALLGIGGVRMLRTIGLDDLRRFHMNEGHAALLTVELLKEEAAKRHANPSDPEIMDEVRRKCVFTTHTPVAAGHDKFPIDLVNRTLGSGTLEILGALPDPPGDDTNGGVLNMTFLGFSLSNYINGVAKRHGEVSRQMFGDYPIDSITNGVHAVTWAAPPLARLFDERIPSWREDSFALRYAASLTREEIRGAHREAKGALIEHVNRSTGAAFDPDVFTIGFGRRATGYKRPDMILDDRARIERIASEVGPIQFVFAGKAHPADTDGKEIIKSIVADFRAFGPAVRGVYLPNYDMAVCLLMVAGSDVWLNTPQPPLEASGTSGMKAAMNGVPSLSTLDGWWLEGCVEGVTGWAIGDAPGAPEAPPADDYEERRRRDAESLYNKLEHVIVPMYYREPARYADVMRRTVALNGSFFHAMRMVHEYVTKAYLVRGRSPVAAAAAT